MAFTFDDDSSALVLGRSGEARLTVTEADTAIAAGSGDLPVLATPRMVALMEQAACAALEGILPSDATTVGTRIEVRHRAASPLGAAVTATATVVEVSGARVAFTVAAVDERDGTSRPIGDGTSRPIGDGTHLRVVVERADFLASL